MKFARAVTAMLGLLLAAPAIAQEASPPAPVKAPPKLLVVVSVDQFSADLFAEYRSQFRGGFARLISGAVFPSGYQGHSATETCPGHSTILTGARPARTGIIANDWTDFKAPRADKTVYCAEDESVPGATSNDYTTSDKHLKVPTLGEWMKLSNPASRVVSVAGKDRAAIMMGGHRIDELWYWFDKNQAFVSYTGRTAPPMVTKINAMVDARRAEAQPAMDLPDFCKPKDRAFDTGGKIVGTGRFQRDADPDHKALGKWKASPEFDEAILSLAAGLAVDMKLGQGAATDLLIVGASATDYVGHGFGTEGTEMCLNLLTLDQNLGKLFAVLDKTGVDYAVVLTADHGGHDIPERNDEHGAPMAARVSKTLNAGNIGKAIGEKLKIAGPVLVGGNFGDTYIDPAVPAKQRKAVLEEAVKAYRADPQVYDVYTRAQIAATPSPKGPPDTWTMLERARAAYDPARSGDFNVALKPRITPIPSGSRGSVATHGSFWDYDRRVPILFWRSGMVPFEQPLSVETADIAPTLAGLIGVKVPVEIDGRCLDLDAGAGDSCK
jgi:predicted AlkP superfamily pyrophosphatase or phosphodiesterase